MACSAPASFTRAIQMTGDLAKGHSNPRTIFLKDISEGRHGGVIGAALGMDGHLFEGRAAQAVASPGQRPVRSRAREGVVAGRVVEVGGVIAGGSVGIDADKAAYLDQVI